MISPDMNILENIIFKKNRNFHQISTKFLARVAHYKNVKTCLVFRVDNRDKASCLLIPKSINIARDMIPTILLTVWALGNCTHSMEPSFADALTSKTVETNANASFPHISISHCENYGKKEKRSSAVFFRIRLLRSEADLGGCPPTLPSF